MGLIERMFSVVFGNGRNAIVETAEVFRINAEADAARAADMRVQALSQHGAEFAVTRQGGFDRFMDGVNRMPRPMLVFSMLALFGAAMVDPIWFSARMQGLQLVPEPLWWLMGAVVSFYFGARHQVKGQEFQRSLAETMARAPQVVTNIDRLNDLRDTTDAPEPTPPAIDPDDNPALTAWRAAQERPQ